MKWGLTPLLIWALTLEAAEQAVSSPPHTARVSGRVVSTHAGAIADATVSLTPLSADGTSAPVLSRTNAQGTFSFDRLPEGRYRLTVSRPGYTDRQLIHAAGQLDSGRAVTLTDGQQVSAIDLVMRHEASIAGRIAEPDGIPAPDVEVFAAIRRDKTFILLPETRTTTEWDGRYRITGLPPGEYLVVVRPGTAYDPAGGRNNAERRAPESSANARAQFDPTLYPGVTASDSAETITVFEGLPTEGIDVWLTPAQRYSVSGRVVAPDGLSLDNVAIEYESQPSHLSGLWTVPVPGDLFTITSVPRGTLVLLVRAESNRGPLAGIATTHVSVGSVEDVEVRLAPPGRVEGRIVYETDVPASGRPTRVVLKQRLLRVSPLYSAPEGSIDDDGRFRIEDALGEFTVELPGLPEGLRVVRVTQHDHQIPDGRFRVAGGETLSSLTVVVGR